MDWCVKPHKECNHKPVVVCNGDEGWDVMEIPADPGGSVKLSAAGSSDLDDDKLSYRWWVYKEAGTYWDEAPIRGANAVNAAITVPENASGRTIHVILEVVDNGKPPLMAYRRVIVTVGGKPVEVPAQARLDKRLLETPITKLSGPPLKTGKWAFYRGVNLNGPAIEIDANKWGETTHRTLFAKTERSIVLTFCQGSQRMRRGRR